MEIYITSIPKNKIDLISPLYVEADTNDKNIDIANAVSKL